MICSNPACTSEVFSVTLEHKIARKEKSADRMPVKLTCTHCKKPVKAYITNEQMLVVSRLLKQIATNQSDLIHIYRQLAEKKPWWKFW